MENSILNLAHEKQRRAELLLRKGRFDEAIACHEIIAQLLAEKHTQMNISFIHVSTRNSSCRDNPSLFVSPIHSRASLEALLLQRDYHTRQADIVKMKKTQYEEYRNTVEKQQRDLLAKQAVRKALKGPQQIVTEPCDMPPGSLRKTVYKTIHDHDSLLSSISLSEDGEASSKPRKDSATVIEELRAANLHLRSLIDNLLDELEAKEDEVHNLTEKLQGKSGDGKEETTPSTRRSIRLAPLPPLAPLEMPLFDFTLS